VKDNESYAKV